MRRTTIQAYHQEQAHMASKTPCNHSDHLCPNGFGITDETCGDFSCSQCGEYIGDTATCFDACGCLNSESEVSDSDSEPEENACRHQQHLCPNGHGRSQEIEGDVHCEECGKYIGGRNTCAESCGCLRSSHVSANTHPRTGTEKRFERLESVKPY